MSKLFNLAKMTTATTGTGTITLGSAVSGFLTFALAGVSDGDIVSYGISDGANSEVGYGTYTAAGTTLARTTILNSTNSGSAIDLSGSAVVFITALSADIALENNLISPTTADVTAVVNSRYLADVSGLTADRNFVLPAANIGDAIELKIIVGDDTYTLDIIGDTGISINNGSAATRWTSLFVTGESVYLVATSTSNWTVINEEGALLDYSAATTATGWSSITSKQVFVHRIGKVVFLTFMITGTSNAAGASFTVPYPVTAGYSFNPNHPISVVNNGSTQTAPGRIRLIAGATTLPCDKQLNSSDGFTTSGSKTIQGQVHYHTDL